MVAKPELTSTVCLWTHPKANSTHLSLLLRSLYFPPTSVHQTDVNKRFCHPNCIHVILISDISPPLYLRSLLRTLCNMPNSWRFLSSDILICSFTECCLSPNIFLTTLFSSTQYLWPFLVARDHFLPLQSNRLCVLKYINLNQFKPAPAVARGLGWRSG